MQNTGRCIYEQIVLPGLFNSAKRELGEQIGAKYSQMYIRADSFARTIQFIECCSKNSMFVY